MVPVMKLLVCVKEVPAPESPLGLSADGKCIAPLGAPERRLGRYDACALEAALQLAEQAAGVRVDVVTVGPAEAAQGLRRALGMGAGAALHIVAQEEAGDPYRVAAAIAAAEKTPYDLILTGAMSEDLMQAAVGPTLAALLDRPCATEVVALRIDADGTALTAEEEREGGARNLVRLCLPAVLTIQSGAWVPRYPSLSGLLKARRRTIPSIAMADLVPEPPRTRITGFHLPPRTRQGRIIEGSPAEKAARLAKILRQRGFLAGGAP